MTNPPPVVPTRKPIAKRLGIDETEIMRHRIFRLYIQHVSIPEIAAMIGLSERAIKGHLARKLKVIRENDSDLTEDHRRIAIAAQEAVIDECWRQVQSPEIDRETGKAIRDAPRVQYLALIQRAETQIAKLRGLEKFDVDITITHDFASTMAAALDRRREGSIPGEYRALPADAGPG